MKSVEFFKIAVILPIIAVGSLAIDTTANMTVAQAADDVTDPYIQDATSYQLTETEYADLRAYMSQAKETLEKTLADARRLSGARLHRRLLLGVNVALNQSGIRHELLLFRYILKRAIEIDQISQRPGAGSQEKALIATSVLLRQIRIAISYYNNIDLPRLGAGLQIPAPDWIKFAHDQVPALLRIIDEAPDETTKLAVTQRALGWTARALNTSSLRRNYSKEIVTLGETLSYLNQGINSVEEAKDVLRKIRPTEGQQQSGSFPASNYPSTTPVRPGPFFPIFPVQVGTDGTQWRPNENNYCRDCFHDGIQIEVGLGPIVEKETGEATAAFAAVNARAQLWASGYLDTGAMLGFALADIRGQVTTDTQPLYHIKATGIAQGQAIFGVWVAFEASQYQQLSDRILRLGWGSGYTFSIGGRDYVMIRAGIGTSWAHVDLPNGKIISSLDVERTLGMSTEVGAVIKAGKFLINVETGFDYLPAKDESGLHNAYRANASLSLGYMLNAIFKGDRITVEGEFVDTITNGENFVVTTLGVNYGFMF